VSFKACEREVFRVNIEDDTDRIIVHETDDAGRHRLVLIDNMDQPEYRAIVVGKPVGYRSFAHVDDSEGFRWIACTDYYEGGPFTVNVPFMVQEADPEAPEEIEEGDPFDDTLADILANL
jgi:hypothetical protein